MTWRWRVALTVIACLALSGAYAIWQDRQRAIGRLEVELRQSRSDYQTLIARADSLARAYHIDTVRLTTYRLRLDTLTTTVELWKHDTVTVTQYVATADSTVRACSTALQTCAARASALSGALVASEASYQALKRLQPRPGAIWRQRAAGALAGVAVYALLDKLAP